MDKALTINDVFQAFQEQCLIRERRTCICKLRYVTLQTCTKSYETSGTGVGGLRYLTGEQHAEDESLVKN